MAKDNGHPNFPKGGMQVYKYDKGVDAAVKPTETLFNTEGKPVVAPEGFKRRRDAQIANRKKQEK
jgi:hypothetical protein